MPPKKAAAVVIEEPASPDPQSEDEKPRSKGKDRDGMSIDDNTLPKTIVTRLAKGVLPKDGNQIQRDAVTAFTRSSTVFINYLASAANEITKSNGKKTIMPKDVLEALDAIEFSGFKARLEKELELFTEKQAEKRSKAKARTSLANTTADAGDPMSEDESARPSKRQRKSSANEEKDGVGADSNILEGDSPDEEEEEEEGGEEEGEDGEEEEEGESGDEEEDEEELEDKVEDLDQDEGMEEEDDALDEDSD